MARLLALAAAGPFPQFGRCAEVKPLSAVDPAELFSVVDNRKEGGTPGWALSEHALPLPTNAWWENLAMAGDTSSPEANVFQMPYVIMADDRGLHAMQPFTTGVTTQGFDKVEALSLSAQEYPKGPRASSWDELGVTLNWPMRDPKQGVKVPLVRGSPYITAEYAGVTPQVTTEQQLRPDGEGLFKIRVDGEAVDCGGGPISGKAFLVELVQSDATWAIFSPPDVKWSCTPEPFSLAALDPMEKGAVRVAIANSCSTGVREHHCQGAPEGRDAAGYAGLLGAHAGAYPVGASVEWEAGDTEGRVTWRWRTRQLAGHDPEPLLQLAYPVHWPLLSEDAMNSVQGEARNSPFRDLRGPSRPVVGDSWLLTYPLFPDVGLYAPRPVAAGLKAEMLEALRGPGGSLGSLWNGSMPDCDFDLPLNYRLGVGDTYFSGKMLARLARLVVIADELGESKKPYFANMVKRLTDRIEVWLREDSEAPFVYDAVWGGLLSCGCLYDDCEGTCEPHCSNKGGPADECPALDMPGMNFGNGYYNDHHFHYGYFVYSAAVAAKYAPKWEEEWREQILAIVRDYANPSAEDPSFPVARHKDWFLGISWAGGIPQAYQNGRNQESTSEAINSYYAVYAYGSSVRAPFAKRLKDFGRILTAMESHGADTYWHVRKGTGIYGDDFPDQVIGILWDHVVEHQTWFGAAPYIVSGIQLLPIIPAMENYLDPDWVRGDSAVYKEQCEGDPECNKGWSWPMCLEQAVVDPAAAYVCVYSLPKNAFHTNNAAANGNSLTNSLHWIATRPEAADLVFGDGGDSFGAKEPGQEDAQSGEGPAEESEGEAAAAEGEEEEEEPAEEDAGDEDDGEEVAEEDDGGEGEAATTTTAEAEATTTPAGTTTSPVASSTAAPTEDRRATRRSTKTTTTTSRAASTTTAPSSTSETVAQQGHEGHEAIADTKAAEKTKVASEDHGADSTTQATPGPAAQNVKKVSEGAAEREGEPIQSGDAVFLKAHTGSYLDTQGRKVRARWNMQGDWQRMVITKEGGGTIWSEDTVFLRTHSGAHLSVDGDTVEALSDVVGPTHELVLSKESDDGNVFPGDVVFLTAHTGKCLDVQGSEVSARWAMHGPWQAFTLEKATAPKEPVAVASEDAGEDADTEEDPLIQWEKFGVVKMAQGSHGPAKERLQNLSGSDHLKKGTQELTKEQKASILSVLGSGAIQRFEARGAGAPAPRPRPRAAGAAGLAAFAGLASVGGLALLLLARRRVLRPWPRHGPRAAGCEYEEAPAGGSSRPLVSPALAARYVEVEGA